MMNTDGMGLVELSDLSCGVEGLDAMLRAAIGDNEYVRRWVPVEIACLIVTVAKRMPDNPEWFPRGQWAMIQAIETRINREIDAAKTPAERGG